MPLLAETPRKRILVVDDDPAILELITLRLDIAGYETRIARDGGDALRAINDTKSAAMILDINMPYMDGFEVLARLRASGTLARLPTLVLTARNNVEDVRRAIMIGARDYMSKPFEDRMLLARVARLLRPPRVAPAGAPAPAPSAGDDEETVWL
jgi:DNA-binding response OmpR family regulator